MLRTDPSIEEVIEIVITKNIRPDWNDRILVGIHFQKLYLCHFVLIIILHEIIIARLAIVKCLFYF